MIATLLDSFSTQRRAWRRARSLRAGRGSAGARTFVRRLSWPAGPGGSLAILAVAFVLAGGLLIAFHARALGAAAAARAASATSTGGAVRALDALQPALPGVAFDVPAQPGVMLGPQAGGALLVLSGMRAGQPVVIDLCSQVLEGSGGRLAPLRIGYRFADVARWAARNEGAGAVTLRNLVLSGAAMPRVDIGGVVRAGGTLQLAWHGAPARWIGDASAGRIAGGERGRASLGRDGWLVWAGEQALRVTRRPAASCPQAGELVLTRYRAAHGTGGGTATSALVAAFPEQGAVRGASLPPGHYRVPAGAPARFEDGALFDALLARGLLRLAPGGMVEMAPRDLAAWRAAAPAQRAADLRAWDGVVLDEAARRLLARLYGRADGAYVREQVRIFNSERRLLAWRVRPGGWGTLAGAWQAAAGEVAVGLDAPMPLAASRLFERLPEGWAPWKRVADWPAGASRARLALALPRAAAGGERIEVLLAGRVLAVEGAQLAALRPGCGGRACTRPDDVSELVLTLEAGSRRILIDAAPLDLARMDRSGDAAWRHLRLTDGRLGWHPVPQAGRTGPGTAVPVLLRDRSGVPLWQAGSPTPSAQAAGLATLLGLHGGHANSIAGMLARLPAPGGGRHEATLSLDLALQAQAHAVLDCVALRRGSWDGTRCAGGAAPPAGRQAGLVLLDTGSGDILAAASAAASAAAGAPAASVPWAELRDFDQVDPARSPLRQAALQHDGGAERSPGSTFKIVSALGLELAAQRDPRLDALLQGMPLAGIDALAAQAGFAFRSGAATYPAQGRLAHITNFRDGTLERRARDGRLGLAEALAYSLNTWFAWTAELSDASLFGKPLGGAPSLRALDEDALAGIRPIADMARRLGFERPVLLDGGLLPPDYDWRRWDALGASRAGIDPIGSRHELRQMAIGLRMQATPLHMAMVAGAVGEGRAVHPRLLRALDGRAAQGGPGAPGSPLGVRLDRVRAGLHGVVNHGTAAGAFRAPEFDGLRAGLHGKTGTAPSGPDGQSTVWFTGWLEPGSISGEQRRLAFAVFVSQSDATGGEHAAPVVAALLRAMLGQNPGQNPKLKGR
jgi:cell division protein FtsI/penicillin-binding protein 2